ncbi:hypothetical protein D9M72_523820 [compost metagenome]
MLTSISISSPNILTATSLRTPVISSLKRICIGCENSVVAPGISCRAFSIFSINSSLVLADVHSFRSFSKIIMSPASIGIGSVGISALPILVTTILISGNLALSSCSALVVASISCESELPEAIIKWVAMSPSSNVGINSPPNELNTNNDTANNPTAAAMIVPLICSAFCSIGL